MSDQLSIHTLGALSIQRDGQPVTGFDQRKVPALLVYLACNPRPHPREVLAEMLWEGRTQSQSLANLRVALTSLRQMAGDIVDITRETVGVKSTSALYLDAEDFDQRLAARSSPDPRRFEEALDLYQGDFLAGFYVDSQGFEDWALLERERLRFRAMEALDRLIDCYLNEGSYASGIARATQLLHIDPLREKTYRQLMELLALSGEREAALAHYETCRRALKEELGVAPTPETMDFYESIRTGQFPGQRPPEAECVEVERPPEMLPPPPRHNLPVQATSFVGREDDIATIITQLNNPGCRLLTLVGPGGIGKTRLALTVAERLVDSFTHGVFFVPLAAVQSQENLVTAITTALPVQSLGGSSLHSSQQGRESEEQQLFNYLREKQLLLVLDNCEHLLDGMGLVDRLLGVAPEINVLATSREPLNLGWEWLHEIGGLRFPGDSDTGLLEDYSAIRLFVERVRRVKSTFRLTDERASIIRICQRVEGMPLGIEIAAAWLRVMSCEEIASTLLDLEIPQRDTPERHRSLRALFDHTWQGLSMQEQETLMKLSVFRGGFTRSAAEAVVQTSPARLATLVNKSLLHRDPDMGRYSVHELLRQSLASWLDAQPALKEQVLDRHADYFAEFLNECHAQLRGKVFEVPEETLVELDNFRAAWYWAIARQNLSAIRRAMRSLYWLYLGPGWYEQGAALLGRAVLALTHDVPPGMERDRILGQLLVMKSVFAYDWPSRCELTENGLAYLRQVGQPEELAFAQVLTFQAFLDTAWSLLQSSYSIYTELDDTWGMAWCLHNMAGYCRSVTFDYSAAVRYNQEATALFRRCGDRQRVAFSLLDQGISAAGCSDYQLASQCYQDSLALSRELGSRKAMSLNLNNLAYIALDRGDASEAERLAQEAVAIQREFGNSVVLCAILDTLGDVKCRQGDYTAAKALFEECFMLVNMFQAAAPSAVANSHKQSGYVCLALGEIIEARRHFVEALRLSRETHSPGLVVSILVDTASLLGLEGQREQALEVLGVTLSHPALERHSHEEARLRADLEAEFGPEAVAAAIERGKDRDVFEVAGEVLAELERMP